MSIEVLNYIRNHDYIYYFLRQDSSYYEYIFKDNNYIYELDNMLKEKYKLRYVDKIDKVKDGIQLLNTFLELIK
ncbi:MAG: hypothetical protein IJG68_06900 [Bacilli bacterium]|nr:hypothetical protein [Bacilli bacterium]